VTLAIGQEIHVKLAMIKYKYWNNDKGDINQKEILTWHCRKYGENAGKLTKRLGMEHQAEADYTHSARFTNSKFNVLCIILLFKIFFCACFILMAIEIVRDQMGTQDK